MKIYIGADHGGFELKKELIPFLEKMGMKVSDVGAKISSQEDDYPDFGLKVALEVKKQPGSLGILICRSGIGMDIVANKVKGIRAALCTHVSQAVVSRAHNDCNVIVLDADMTDRKLSFNLVKIFVQGRFSEEERHIRRIKKITDIETRQNY